jgi:hypothetical protein
MRDCLHHHCLGPLVGPRKYLELLGHIVSVLPG